MLYSLKISFIKGDEVEYSQPFGASSHFTFLKVPDTKSSEPTYQKDCFFDEISRDSRQAQRPKTSERSLNMQTFGAAASRRRPTGGRYYNRRPGNWAGSGANGGQANGAAHVSA